MYALKKIKNRRPISRILYPNRSQDLCHLSGPDEKSGSALPTPLALTQGETARAAQIPTFAKAMAGKQGVHGISTRKVYPFRKLPIGIVRSYHTFSPLPRLKKMSRGGYFLRHYLCFLTEARKLRRLDGAVLCVVRTFLPERRQSSLRFFIFLSQMTILQAQSLIHLAKFQYWLKLCLGTFAGLLTANQIIIIPPG